MGRGLRERGCTGAVSLVALAVATGADTPTREAVAPLLRGRLGRDFLFVAECASTQRLLEPAAPEGAVVVTDHQTDGRGGRPWSPTTRPTDGAGWAAAGRRRRGRACCSLYRCGRGSRASGCRN